MIQKRSITKFLAIAKLYTMKNIISKALMNNEINNEEFTITMSKTKKNYVLKQNVRMTKSEIGDTKRGNLMKGNKKIKP